MPKGNLIWRKTDKWGERGESSVHSNRAFPLEPAIPNSNSHLTLLTHPIQVNCIHTLYKTTTAFVIVLKSSTVLYSRTNFLLKFVLRTPSTVRYYRLHDQFYVLFRSLSLKFTDIFGGRMQMTLRSSPHPRSNEAKRTVAEAKLPGYRNSNLVTV